MNKNLFFDAVNSNMTEDGKFGVVFHGQFSKEEYVEMITKLKSGAEIEVQL